MDTKSPTQLEEASATADLSFLSASSLVASGSLEEAEALLCQNGQPPTSPRALDLLARIAVQSGDIARGRVLWQAALQADPSFGPAREAIRTLNTPWYALAVTKRVVALAFISMAACLALIGSVILFHMAATPVAPIQTPVPKRIVSKPKTSPAAAQPEPKPQEPAAAINERASVDAIKLLEQKLALRDASLSEQIQGLQKTQTDLLSQQAKMGQQVAALITSNQALANQQSTLLKSADQSRRELRTLAEAYANDRRPVTNSVPAPAPLPPLKLSVSGIAVEPHSGSWIIRFDSALFDRDDHLKMGSESLIESVAKGLVSTQEKINVQVIGFADNDPPTWPWSTPVADEKLAQLRADRVKTILAGLSLFPSNALSAKNGPSTELPHPGDNRRNRTVVLLISRQL